MTTYSLSFSCHVTVSTLLWCPYELCYCILGCLFNASSPCLIIALSTYTSTAFVRIYRFYFVLYLISYAAVRTKSKHTNIFQQRKNFHIRYGERTKLNLYKIIMYKIFSTRNITKLWYTTAVVRYNCTNSMRTKAVYVIWPKIGPTPPITLPLCRLFSVYQEVPDPEATVPNVLCRK